MSSSYSFKWNTVKIQQIKHNTIMGLIKMGYDINNRAKAKAPVLTGTLVNSIRVDVTERDQGNVYVLAGGTAGVYKAPYARRREFENNKHPNTKHYMRNAFNEATKNYSKYFKEITK